jgi:hypothetical protein
MRSYFGMFWGPSGCLYSVHSLQAESIQEVEGGIKVDLKRVGKDFVPQIF